MSVCQSVSQSESFVKNELSLWFLDAIASVELGHQNWSVGFTCQYVGKSEISKFKTYR